MTPDPPADHAALHGSRPRSHMSPSELAQKIRRAFAAVPRPQATSIAPHGCDECDELRADFAAHTVDAIPLDVLHKHVWDLPLLSAEAKQYFLPAWLIEALSSQTWDFVDAAMQYIDSGQRFDPPIRYTDEQWQVLIDWLEFHAAAGDEVTRESAVEARRQLGS